MNCKRGIKMTARMKCFFNYDSRRHITTVQIYVAKLKRMYFMYTYIHLYLYIIINLLSHLKVNKI
jgi:hypothetical protein